MQKGEGERKKVGKNTPTPSLFLLSSNQSCHILLLVLTILSAHSLIPDTFTDHILWTSLCWMPWIQWEAGENEKDTTLERTY
jgi:hypothetical protein